MASAHCRRRCFYLPPLHFTPHEAAALFLGAQMLGAHAVGLLAADGEQSLHKLAIALPKPPRAEMERLSEVIRFDLDEPRLAALQQAIGEQRVELSALRRCAERILAFPASQLCWSSDSPLGNFH